METDEILAKVKSLSRLRRACTYHKVDLHVHSPASSDYSRDNNVSPYEFVSEFVRRGFHLIAITDHNTGKYIDQAIEARDQIATNGGDNITILPGVELYVSPGIHLLAVLPEGGSAAVSDLLSRLELPVEHHGDTTKLVSKPIGDIARAVHERGGILIGAHCNSTNGIVQKLIGQARLEWLRELDAIEINSGSADDHVSSTINYVVNELRVTIPFTFGSDSHDCTTDLKGMWVKMAEPSLASLRQLTFEPQLRISRTEPLAPSYGRIVGFTSTHGIYANQQFRFSPNLNVLLGGRGAGKSAAIDLIRFAFEAEPRTGDAYNEVFSNRIMGFLQSVGEVLVVIMGTDGEEYVITRSGAYERPSTRAGPDFTERARVYQIASDNVIQRDLRPLDLLGIEFYGQGEVARLANLVGEQLRLIDENLDLSTATDSIAVAESLLGEGERRIIENEQRLEQLQVEAAERASLEERLSHLAQSLADPIFAERTRWDRERMWLQGQQDWVKAVLESLPGSLPPRNEAPLNIDESSAKDVLEKVREVSDRILANGRSSLDGLREMLEEAASELNRCRTAWDSACEVSENQYRVRLTELGATNLAQVAAEKRAVEEKLTHLGTVVEPEIRQIELAMSSLTSERFTYLARLKDARLTISQSRSAFVEELNARLRGSVRVDLSDHNTSLYFDAVYSSLQGSGMQQRENQISLACKSFAPEKLTEIIRAGSIDQLTAIGITENNATRMVRSLTDDVLYKIERVDVPQLPSISIKREGENVFTELLSLSVGEKCSAILSIALLSKGKTLVIDQPEDDLDHAFIIDSIVESIRNAKSDRQIIAATHNPNIPVLGDAEMVFRVARQAGGDVCRIQNSGGLELPQVTAEVQSLEGGAEAFERRRRRYSGVL